MLRRERRREPAPSAPTPNGPRRRTEAELVVDCAYAWMPYGGPPADEILEQFGMSEQRFREERALILSRGCPARQRYAFSCERPTSCPWTIASCTIQVARPRQRCTPPHLIGAAIRQRYQRRRTVRIGRRQLVTTPGQQGDLGQRHGTQTMPAVCRADAPRLVRIILRLPVG